MKIEIKWALIFSVMGSLWMFLEKLSGLHGKYIDYHLYLTNLFAIPAIIVMVLALKDKKNNFYSGQMKLYAGIDFWNYSFSIYCGAKSINTMDNLLCYFTGIFSKCDKTFYQYYVIQGFIGALVLSILIIAITMIFIGTNGK